MPEQLTAELKTKLITVAARQVEEAVKYRKPRLDTILKNEESYYLKVKPALPGRVNIPLPIVAGFVDSLKSKTDDAPKVTFGHQGLANLRLAQKVTSAWDILTDTTHGKYAYKDRAAKTLAIFGGRAIFKAYASSDDGYHNHLDVVDHFDFLCEPKGGGDLDDHLYLGQQNIYRTQDELEKGIKAGFYDVEAATTIIKSIGTEESKKNDSAVVEKAARYKALGLDMEAAAYVGQNVANLVEWYMQWFGKRYYLLFDPVLRQAVRISENKVLFAKDTQPFVSWATHEDPFNFWSKASVDDIRPVADGMEMTFNEGLNNLRKRNWDMKAYDPSVFPDPSQLEYTRPDQLVTANSNMGERSIANGIYHFQTPDNTAITVNLVQFLDAFIGKKTGVTDSLQGAAAKDVKVGVYYGDLQQAADRLGLQNKSYSEAWAKLGSRFKDGLQEHLDEPLLVKMVGTHGAEWDELKRSELKGVDDFDIKFTGGASEMQANEVKRKQRIDALAPLIQNPRFSARLSDRWVVEQMLQAGGYDNEEIRAGMDLDYDGTYEELSRADMAVEEILRGKTPKLYRGATTSFIQYILNFATDQEVKDEEYQALITYARAHFDYAKENAIRNARLKAQITPPEAAPAAGGVPTVPAPTMTPAGMTASRSQEYSAGATPPVPAMRGGA